MRIAYVLAAVACGLGWPNPAMAQQTVPLIIHWLETAPTRIVLEDGDESRPLKATDRTKTITDAVVRPPAQKLYARVKLIVFYGEVDIPIILNVRPSRTKIEFWLPFKSTSACFNQSLLTAEGKTDSAIDAMRRMMLAAYMLRIQTQDNDCASTGLDARAKRARLERNANLATGSYGLFALNEDWRRDLMDLPENSFSGTTPRAIANAASSQATGALVASLYNVDMKRVGTAIESLAIAKNLGALSSDPDAKAVIDTVPLTDAIATYTERVRISAR